METCKLCVSIPGKSLKLDMPRPDAEVWFTTLVDALLNTQPEEEPEQDEDTENECDQKEQGYPIETIAQELREKIESTQETAPP